MAHLGTYGGTGRVVVNGADIGSANYEIDVYRDDIPAGDFQDPRATVPGLKTARGRIEADPSLIGQVQTARVGTLRLGTGDSFDFLITRWALMSRHADITVTGPIPFGP
jgi:hypothetical protein